MRTAITIRQIEYASAVARFGGFKRASERLHISQSAVSEQVRLLEEHMGVKLFDRSSGQVELTPSGKMLLAKAQDVLDELDELSAMSFSVQDDTRTSVKIGFASGLGARIAHAFNSGLADQFPDLRFEFSVAPSSRLLRLLGENRINLGISAKSLGQDLALGIVESDLASVPFSVVLPQTHLLASTQDAICVEDLTRERIIMNELGYGYSSFVLKAFQSIGRYPIISMVSDNVDFMLDLVSYRNGLAIVPAVCIDPGDARNSSRYIVARPLETDLRCEFALFMRERTSDPRMQDLAEAIRDLDFPLETKE